MNKWTKILCCFALSVGFLFTSLGYAALSDTLLIDGTAKVDIPAGVYIIAMEEVVDGESTLDRVDTSYITYTTTLDSNLSRRYKDYSGTVTYKITVLNNTQYTYAYRDIYFQKGLYSNDYINAQGNQSITISCSLGNAEPKDKLINSGETKELYVTYTLKTGLNREKDYRTLINIRFGINVDSLEQAHNALMDKFAEILNSPSGYAELTEKIDDKFDGNQEWTSNFIGNVDGSSSADSVTMSNLFGGRLQMVIGDEQKTVTALIKHEDVDGDQTTGDRYSLTFNNGEQLIREGCEFTIYLTTEKLGSWSYNSYPTVYAATFTRSQNANGSYSEWYRIGDIYKGTARVVGYTGEQSGGSFDTGTWRSVAQTYTPSDNYSYSLNAGMTIQQVVQSVDNNAVQALEELLTRAKEIIDGDKYAGTGLVALEVAYNNAKPYFDVNADGNITVHNHVPVSELIEHIDELAKALEAFENV